MKIFQFITILIALFTVTHGIETIVIGERADGE